MALSLNLYIYFSLCLTHMACFLHVHTSSATTKVAPYKGLVRPQARQLRMKQGEVDMARMRGAGAMVGVGIVAETPPFFSHPPFFLSFISSVGLFPLLNLASGHSPPQKAGGKNECGTFILPSSLPSIYPTLCLYG